ncbi:hypothetical protein EST38_g6916 [Candolleomyces aberdarensis]|uniref:Mug135-like C-terminal domain-containing protein n=1 Tax=Candolleomyces aberdarensis TaxID=2316362 RepID=A0A4Q2DJU0_9AGAR|nr:hypothetical protein EST38_g6916 [Candolleomyces aberdarensis]
MPPSEHELHATFAESLFNLKASMDAAINPMRLDRRGLQGLYEAGQAVQRALMPEQEQEPQPGAEQNQEKAGGVQEEGEDAGMDVDAAAQAPQWFKDFQTKLEEDLGAMKNELRNDLQTMKNELRNDLQTSKNEFRGKLNALFNRESVDGAFIPFVPVPNRNHRHPIEDANLPELRSVAAIVSLREDDPATFRNYLAFYGIVNDPVVNWEAKENMLIEAIGARRVLPL